MFYNLLVKAQLGNQEAMLELINRFQPLLKKYAKKMEYDDAYEDCVLFFIELIKKMNLKKINMQSDQGIASYIKVSVAHFYHKKIQNIFAQRQEIMFSELTQEQRYYIEVKLAKQDEKDVFVELGIDRLLNSKEKTIVYLVYVKGYTTAEIARTCHKSRQSVNQLKRRSLNKLRKIKDIEI